jgi:MFS family permease
MWRVMPVNLAQWALGGFLMSLGPTLVKTLSGSATPLLGGALIAVLVLAAAIAILFVRLRDPRPVLTAGAGLLAAGLATVLLAIAAGQLALLFIGAAVAGLGFGAAFNASVRSLVGVTAPQERAGMMSAFFVFSYLAFSVPAIAAGLSAGFFGLLPTAIGYGAVLVVLCTWVFAQSLKGPRS